MASLASINIRFKADLKQFSTEMQTALRELDKAGQKFQQIGRTLSVGLTLPIVAAGGAAIKFASDYEESLNKVDVAFKSSSGQVKTFARDTLQNFGIAEGTALDLASTYGDMATSLGLTTGEAAKMSTSLVGLAGDLSSFKNISIDIANTALTGIFTGETESLKKLGVVLTEANLQQFAYSQGIQTAIKDMSQAEKVQLRYNYILSVTKNAQGDFARTQGGAANQLRIFQESLKQLAQQFGSIILPAFTKVITSLNGMITSFGKLSEGTKTTIVIVAGLLAVIGPLALALGAVLAVIPSIVAGYALISASIAPVAAGIVLLGGILLVLKNAYADTVKEVVSLSGAQKLNQKVVDEATKSIVDQKTNLELLLITARNENESKKERLKAIKDINAIAPEYLGNLTLENINTDKARQSIEKYNAALLSGATARAASKLLEENQAAKIQAGFEREKALAEYNEKRANAIAKGWEAEKAFYEENNRILQFANEALERKNQKYDAEAKILTDIYAKNQENLGLVKEEVTQNVKKIEVLKGVKKSISEINSLLQAPISQGSIASYDAQIAELQKFRNEVATTAAQVKLADDAIKKIELAKSLKFDPTSLITISGGFSKMVDEIQAKANGMKSSLDASKAVMVDYGTVVGESIRQLAADAAVGFGETLGAVISGTAGIGDIFSGLLGMVANFMKDLGKSLIQIAVANIALKKAFANPFAALAAGVALVALGSAFQSKMSDGPQRFENGGIVGGTSFYGDKILARVNSGELILNQKQQAAVYGRMNSAGDSGLSFAASTKIQGSDLLVILERAEKKKNRLG